MRQTSNWPNRRFTSMAALLVALFAPARDLLADEFVLTQSTTLDPSRTYGQIVIRASNITIDGAGACLIGAAEGDPKQFKGTAIFASGVSGVVLKNIKAKGWETGLHVVDGSDWTIEGCDFSDNFHDPDFGWGENGRRGGIVLERVNKNTLRGNKANRVWDACTLVGCDDNLLERNDFSHASNTCLKLWTSCRNTVKDNNLSYGLRISPGEVHARDSTSVLIESGSNDNRFIKNDCTHGGDGIFVRVLNQWVSTGNLFEENDCSYANNNCVEAWSPRNTWRRNKANHGSYGFWLGASDQNVLVENEASYNGLPDGFHNSPHLPDAGHAGIVFMFGPSSHTVIRGNRCLGNNGAGIAAIGDLQTKGQKWSAFHWIVEQNTLADNRWGVYLRHVCMFDLAANRFERNSLANVERAENTIGVVEHVDTAGITVPPRAKLAGPSVAHVGQLVAFDASESRDPDGRALTYRWQIGPDEAGSAPKMAHTFHAAGFYRVALTVNNGLLSDLAWRDLYVVEDLPELGTEEQAADAEPRGWTWNDVGSKVAFANDAATRLIGKGSLRAHVDPYSGGRVTLRFTLPGDSVGLTGKTRLVFWLKTRNENVPAWQDLNPLVAFIGPDGARLQLTPARDFLSAPTDNEAREGWTYFAVPLAGSADWQPSGDKPSAVKSFEFGFDSWGAPPLTVWIDGLSLK